MPPKILPKELAPPMMAVVFHLRDFIKTSNPSEQKNKFIDFVSDYILYPTKDKAYCDESSIKKYGLMPPLNQQLNDDEAKAIAQYIYFKYDPIKFYKAQKQKAIFESLPKGEQVIKKNGCISCHGITKKKIAPSFKYIAKVSTHNKIKNTILNGSKNSYKGFEKATMPPFSTRLSTDDLNNIVQWMDTLNIP